MYYLCIVENVLAVKDAWFLGDKFPAMRDEAVQANNLQLYIYRYYNVKHFYSSASSNSKNVFNRLLETIAYAIGKCERLPDFVITILDKDLLDALCCQAGYTPPDKMDRRIEKSSIMDHIIPQQSCETL